MFWPVFFGGKVFFGGDVNLQFYPYFNFLKKNIENIGELNFWSPEILSGFPLYVTLTGGFFYPLNIILVKLFSFITAYHLVTFINFLLAGVFTYLYLVNLKLKRPACLIGALTYILSQYLISYQALLSLSNVFWFLPFLFLCLLKISKGKNKYIIFGGLALGLAWLSSNPQFVLFALVSSFFYALFLGKQVKVLILMGLISIPIGIWQVLPSYQFSALSSRALGLIYEQASAGALSVTDITSYIFPYFRLPHFNWGRQGKLYIGILPLFFALLIVFYAFLSWRKKIKINKNIIFFILLYFFALLCAIPYSPLFYLMHLLPVFKYFRIPLRWMQVSVFSLSVLSAYGYSYFLKKPNKFRVSIKIAGYFIGFLSIFVLAWNILFRLLNNKIFFYLKTYFEKNLYFKTTQLSLDYYYVLIRDYTEILFDNFNLGNYRFLLSFGFILLSYWLIRNYFYGKINKTLFQVFAILIVCFNLLTNYYIEARFIPRDLYLRTPKTVKIIKEREGDMNSFRIFSFMPGFSEYSKLVVPYNPSSQDLFIFQSEIIALNLNSIYGLQSVDGYDNIMPQENAKILSLIGSEYATIGDKLSEQKIPLEEKVKIFLSRLNLLSRQNVKYIISAYQLEGKRLNLVGEVKVTKFKIPIYIYENLDVLPRIHFAGENGVSEIFVREYKGGKIVLEIKTDSLQWLIFRESNLPNWQASIDGEPVQIYTTDYIYQTIKVPAGEHKVEFEYRGVIN